MKNKNMDLKLHRECKYFFRNRYSLPMCEKKMISVNSMERVRDDCFEPKEEKGAV